MSDSIDKSRRTIVKTSAFGLLSISMPNILFARSGVISSPERASNTDIPDRYPAIDDEITAEMVGVSHFDFKRVKELLEFRSELARATWDWGFGDWESAIGAASHVGRRDIVEILLESGARPDIFTFATLGDLDAVRAMIEARPGVESIPGPHGISLLQHAKNGLRSENLTANQIEVSEALVAYLESLGSADPQQKHLAMTDEEKSIYLGDYMYGEGPEDGFSIQLNMRDLLSLGRIDKFGGTLYRQTEHEFEYNGVSSVRITFQVEGGNVQSLTIHEPDITVVAVKV